MLYTRNSVYIWCAHFLSHALSCYSCTVTWWPWLWQWMTLVPWYERNTTFFKLLLLFFVHRHSNCSKTHEYRCICSNRAFNSLLSEKLGFQISIVTGWWHLTSPVWCFVTKYPTVFGQFDYLVCTSLDVPECSDAVTVLDVWSVELC